MGQGTVSNEARQQTSRHPTHVQLSHLPALGTLGQDITNAINRTTCSGLGQDGIFLQNVVVECPIVQRNPRSCLGDGPSACHTPSEIDGKKSRERYHRDGRQNAQLVQLVGSQVGRVVQQVLDRVVVHAIGEGFEEVICLGVTFVISSFGGDG